VLLHCTHLPTVVIAVVVAVVAVVAVVVLVVFLDHPATHLVSVENCCLTNILKKQF